MRFLYFYLMRDDPDLVRSLAPKHAQYWQSLSLNDYEGGPFADRSGGLILFAAGSHADAEAAVANDPFQTSGVIQRCWVKQWMPDATRTETDSVMVGGGR